MIPGRFSWFRPAAAYCKPNCVLPVPVAPTTTASVPGRSPPPNIASKRSMPVECRRRWVTGIVSQPFAKMRAGLESEPAVARRDAPTIGRSTILHDDRFLVQGHGRADVPRHAKEHIAHAEPLGLESLDRQMLFAVIEHFAVGRFEQLHAQIGRASCRERV